MPLGLSKKIVKRSLCNCRCAIGIRDAENLEKGYMAHAVPLVFGANFFPRSTNISLCAMSRLDLVTFWFLLDAAVPLNWDCRKKLPKKVCVTVAVPLGLSKKIDKRSLCNSRCAIKIVKRNLQKKSV